MRGAKTEALIAKLNPIIRGWVNYHKHVVAKKTFGYVDWQIQKALWRWAKSRHPKKGNHWIQHKYFPTFEYIGSTFVAKVEIGKGQYQKFALVKATWTRIQRHIKVRQEANPFDPKYKDYFKKRQRQQSKLAWTLMKLERETAFADADRIAALEQA
jgi:RNA-directed DNA polymerase